MTHLTIWDRILLWFASGLFAAASRITGDVEMSGS